MGWKPFWEGINKITPSIHDYSRAYDIICQSFAVNRNASHAVSTIIPLNCSRFPEDLKLHKLLCYGTHYINLMYVELFCDAVIKSCVYY